MSEKIYYVNKEHKFPFQYNGETWVKYYPGFEGFYAISNQCNILSLERKLIKTNGHIVTIRRKKLKQLLKGGVNKKTLITFNLHNDKTNGIPVTVSINQIKKILND